LTSLGKTKMIRSATSHQNPATLFDAILDRSQTEIPEYYLPSAAFVLIAGPTILNALGYVSGSPAPAGWRWRAAGFRKQSRADDRALWVQRCGDLWIVERTPPTLVGQDEALVCAFGNPIWTRTSVSAMLLAQHCDPLPLAPIAGGWMPVTR
jgi:hypothetical protein